MLSTPVCLVLVFAVIVIAFGSRIYDSLYKLLNQPTSKEVPDACKPVLESLEAETESKVQASTNGITSAQVVFRKTVDGKTETLIDEEVPHEKLQEFFEKKVEPLLNDSEDEFAVDENNVITEGAFIGAKLLPNGHVEIDAETAKVVRKNFQHSLTTNELDNEERVIVKEILKVLPEEGATLDLELVAETCRQVHQKQFEAMLVDVATHLAKKEEETQQAATDYVATAKVVKKRRVRATKVVRDAKKAKTDVVTKGGVTPIIELEIPKLPKGWVDTTPLKEEELETPVKPSVTKDAVVPQKKNRKSKKSNVQTK